MPGSRMSCTKAAPPVTLAGMSKRGIDLPTILWLAGGFGGALALASRLRSTLGGQLAIADLAAVRRRDHAVGDRQLIGRHAEPLGGELEQDRAHLGAGHAQGGAAVLDRLAAGGLALVRRLAGVAGDHLDARERQIELLGRDLGERGEDPLPELDLAGEDGRACRRR